MDARRPTLVRRLALLVSLGLGAVWVVAVLAMALVLGDEQDELYDQQLVISADTLLPILSRELRAGLHATDADADEGQQADPDEALVWRLIDRDARVLAASPAAGTAVFPDRAEPRRYARTVTHVVYTTD